MLSLDTLTALLSHYGYILLFPIAIIEGPIITVIAGLLVYQGYMNLFLVYGVVVLADLFGDLVFYLLGRYNLRFVERYGRYVGITQAGIEKAKKHYAGHHNKTIIFSKLVHGIGVAGLVVAGLLRVPYTRFLGVGVSVSFFQSACFLALGYFLGSSYSTIGAYIDYTAEIVTVVVLVVCISYYLYTKRKKNDK